MNMSFQSLPVEARAQVIVACADMVLTAIGRFLRMAIPLLVIGMIVFLFLFPFIRKRRRRPRC